MKVALTVWDKRISPVFDVCREALVLEVESRKVVSTSAVDLNTATPLLKIERLAELGVKTLICGAISEPLQRELNSRGLMVIGFVAGDVDEVVQAFISGMLPDPALAMPGCCDRLNRFRRRRNQGHGCGSGWGRRGR